MSDYGRGRSGRGRAAMPENGRGKPHGRGRGGQKQNREAPVEVVESVQSAPAVPKPAWGKSGNTSSIERSAENLPVKQAPPPRQFEDAPLHSIPPNVLPPPQMGPARDSQAVALYKSDFTLNGNRAKRPGVGKMGYRQIDLFVNYFKLDLPVGLVHQYDVDIKRMNVDNKKHKEPKRYPQLITRKIFDKICQEYNLFKSHLPIYDGNKIVITKRSLGITKPQDFQVTIQLEDDDKPTFNVTIKPSKMKNGGSDGQIDLDTFHRYIKTKQGEIPMEAIKAIDLVFKHGPSLVYTPIGKSFFRKPDANEVPPHGEGREIWFGYSQSVRPTEWFPIINIDLTATTFYEEGPVLEFMKNVTGERYLDKPLRDRAFKTFHDEIKGLKVKVTHNAAYERKFRVVGATRKNASELTFPLEKDKTSKPVQVSIAWYFQNQYKKTLQYPHLPCLQMSPKEKNIYIPVEFCKIMPDQHCKKKLSETLTAKMIKETLRNPKQRFKEIQDNVQDVKRRAAPFLKEFQIGMSTNPLEVKGRVLNPPKIVYVKGKDEFLPKQGAWNLQEHQFYDGAVIDNWAILNFGKCNQNERMKFEHMLTAGGNECGLRLGKCMYNEDIRDTRMSVEEILKRLKKKFENIQLVIVILPPKNMQGGRMVSYEEIKQTCDTQIGLVTQCIKDINVSDSRKCSRQLISNLCQKINAKMGGTNNTISAGREGEQPKLLDSPVIIMGADVTHPAPNSNDPSIAAVVGSVDRYVTKYAARIKVQKNVLGYQARVEIILELKDMVKSLLKCFYKKTGQKPQRIIFYRDGVSEGQFSEVCSYEINQIKIACKELGDNYQPKLTFIVVQKRHSTRFCPKYDKDGCGRPGNVPPGTTVDTGIVSPVDFDFYLCSHFGLQGTSKPTHYTVLWDESNLTADEIQMLSYYLCHTYSRCTRAISLPTPVQYAHLAAFRARSHIKKALDGSSNGSQHSSGKYGTMVEIDDIAEAVTIEKKLEDSMYFV